ncbi:MAG: hypothetical protein EBQ96_07670 [Proteobacteria bacterium]|nr:hypothetical protein [Pseudomonadota bacterium]
MSFDAKTVYGLIAIVVTLVGIAPYIVGMLKGHTKPHIFSWFLWAFTGWVVTAAQIWDSAGPGLWGMLTASIVCTLVFFMSLKDGKKDITRSDWVMLSTALLAIPAWVVTSHPLLSVIIVTGIDLIAYGPTIRKSWKKPGEEVAFMYVAAGTWQAFSLLAMENYTLVTCLSTASLLAMNCFFVPYLLVRRAAVKNA